MDKTVSRSAAQDASGRAMISDFGISTVRDATTTLSQTAVQGTIGYQAPELLGIGDDSDSNSDSDDDGEDNGENKEAKERVRTTNKV